MKKKTLTMLLLVCCLGVALSAYAATGDLFVNGKLGVGTTTPADKLHIKANGYGLLIQDTAGAESVSLNLKNNNGFWHISGPRSYDSNHNLSIFWNNNTAFSRILDITSSGNVGIGTISPDAKLMVKYVGSSGGGIEGLKINQVGTGGSGIAFDRNGALTGLYQIFQSTDNKLKIGRDGIADFMTFDQSGNVGIGTAGPITKLHVVVPNATTNTGGVGTSYSTVFTNAVDTTLALRSMGSGVFHIATDSIGRELRLGGGLFEEAVTIKSGGNVGIGTASPASDAAWASPGLDISGTRGAAILRTTGATGIATLRMTGPGTSYVDDWHINMYAGANSYLAFYPKAGGGNTGLVLKNDGNVGIGTATPAYKLDVAGTINAKEVLVNGAPLAGGSNQWSNLTAPAAGVYYNTGNVGIGTTSPAYKLDVNGTGRFTEGISVTDGYSNLTFLGNTPSIKGGYSLLLQGNANPDNPRIFLDGSGGSTTNSLSIGSNTNPYQMYINTVTGNVGIGTTNPQIPLAVAAGGQAGIGHTTKDYVPSVSGSGVFTALGADTGNTYGEIRALSGGGGTWYNLILQKGGGNVGIGTATPTRKLSFGTGQSSIGIDDQGVNTNMGGMLFINSGSGGTGATGGAGGNLRLEAGYAGGSGNNDGGDVFLTPGNATGSGTRGRIVIDSARGPGSDGGLGFNSTLRFRSHGQANWDIVNDGSLNFIYNPNPTGPTNVVFKSNGNVGIGTTTPQGKLDVNGAIYQRGGVLHADYVFEPAYKLESVEEHARFMWQEKHLKAVDSQRKDENGQEIIEIGGRTRGILEELEKAHIYIEQLHNQNKELTRRVETLEKSLSMKKER